MGGVEDISAGTKSMKVQHVKIRKTSDPNLNDQPHRKSTEIILEEKNEAEKCPENNTTTTNDAKEGFQSSFASLFNQALSRAIITPCFNHPLAF